MGGFRLTTDSSSYIPGAFLWRKCLEQGAMLLVFLFANYMVLTKAAHIPITYDEAFSYMNYARSFSGFWTLHIANNHYLNSLAMQISAFMFGNEPFILRLPNIVSFYIYSLAAYVVSCRLPLKAFAFSALVAN